MSKQIAPRYRRLFSPFEKYVQGQDPHSILRVPAVQPPNACSPYEGTSGHTEGRAFLSLEFSLKTTPHVRLSPVASAKEGEPKITQIDCASAFDLLLTPRLHSVHRTPLSYSLYLPACPATTSARLRKVPSLNTSTSPSVAPSLP